MSDKVETFCPQCGPDVEVDDDGCCVTCGATAIGDGVDQIASLTAEVGRLTEQLHLANVDAFQNEAEANGMRLVVDAAVARFTDHGGYTDEPIHKSILRKTAQMRTLEEAVAEYVRALDGEP